MPIVYDLHLHSHYSDGDLSPAQLVAVCRRRGLTGISLTDHNGLGGVEQAAAAAGDLVILPGLEISTVYQGIDVHVLGYSRRFDRAVLAGGLAKTRQGYTERVQAMVELCHRAGYGRVSFETIVERRRGQVDPIYMAYDVARELMKNHGLTWPQARRLTIAGGPCYIPYGSWAMHPNQAISLIHQAGGVASLAHPGTYLERLALSDLDRLVASLAAQGLDAVEVWHPFHDSSLVGHLQTITDRYHLLVTGGSDWHGPDRYNKHDELLGRIGVSQSQYQALMAIMPTVHT